jgi:hypothetical protein
MMWKPMEGVVKSYSPMRAVFKVTYVDDDWEELDFEELQMILIMGFHMVTLNMIRGKRVWNSMIL